MTILAAAAAVGLPSTAHAEADASSRALAVQFFDEAEALMAQGRVAAACPKFAESNRLDPQLGALIYLADCYEKNGQLASAWGSFREAEEIARKRGDARADHAHERSSALEPRLSYLTINVPAASDTPGLTVLRDGAVVPRVGWNGKAVVDMGTYRIEARAPGRKPWRGQVVIASEASSESVAIPKLEVEPAAPGAVPVASGTQPLWSSSRRVAAIAVGGLGLVGVGVGGFVGLSAQASLSDSKRSCNDHNYCTLQGHELAESAKSKALVATVATGAGVAALATAAVLWFTAPKLEAAGQRQSKSKRQAWALAPTPEAWGLEVRRAF